MDVKQLLDKISKAVEEDEKIKNAQKKSGAQFNVFSVMGVQSREVKLHSAFLAELLNPKGSHGQGDVFLKKFLKLVGFENKKFKTENAYVNNEEAIGRINDKGTKGGQLDILIKSASEKFAIIIENKIYATDGTNQLLRYKNYLEGTRGGKNPGLELSSRNYKLFYLTLDGHEPDKKSTRKNDDYFTCISYDEDIREWLDECLEIVGKIKSDNQNLKNSIVQYKQIVDELTGNNIDMEIRDEILDSVRDDLICAENAENSLIENLNKIKSKISANNGDDEELRLIEKKLALLKNCINIVKDEILGEYLFPELERIANKNGLALSESKDDISNNLKKQYNGFSFYKETQKTETYISFEFHKPNYQEMLYGIWDDWNNGDGNPELRRAMEKLGKKGFHQWQHYWPYYNWFNNKKEDSHWNAKEFIKLKDKTKDFMEPIETRLKEILDYLKKNNLEKYF